MKTIRIFLSIFLFFSFSIFSFAANKNNICMNESGNASKPKLTIQLSYDKLFSWKLKKDNKAQDTFTKYVRCFEKNTDGIYNCEDSEPSKSSTCRKTENLLYHNDRVSKTQYSHISHFDFSNANRNLPMKE